MWLEDDAFSGKPVWSTWLGSAEEDEAVFVDESQCIGCLNCAMIAENSFAIESTHERARAIWQWGVDKEILEDAISACPVDCIKCVIASDSEFRSQKSRDTSRERVLRSLRLF